MTNNMMLNNIKEYYENTENVFTEDGIRVDMTLSSWGCFLEFKKEINAINKDLLDTLNAGNKMMYFAFDNKSLIARMGVLVEGKPSKGSLNLLLNSGLSSFKAAACFLSFAQNE